MCCVITNAEHKVVSISLIPGASSEQYTRAGYHVYFPIVGDWPRQGEYYKPELKPDESWDV